MYTDEHVQGARKENARGETVDRAQLLPVSSWALAAGTAAASSRTAAEKKTRRALAGRMLQIDRLSAQFLCLSARLVVVVIDTIVVELS